MARPLRVEYEQAVYHVTARGNERRDVFRDDKDRYRFLDTLAESVERFGIVVHGYCLMPNHHHLLLQTPRANLSRAVGWVQSTYSVRFNHRHRRSGHLFQGRFKAQVVEADGYARTLIEYIHLNPVRPRDRRQPIPPTSRRTLDTYSFSSHRAYLGTAEPLPWLSTQWLSYFGKNRSIAQKAYRQSIADRFGKPIDSPWSNVRGGLALGSDAFAEKIKLMLSAEEKSDSIEWVDPAGEDKLQSALAEILRSVDEARLRIWLRVKVGGEPISAVARALGYADASGVSRVVQRLESAAEIDPALRRKLNSLKANVMSKIDGL